LERHNETNKGEEIIQVLDPAARQELFMDPATTTPADGKFFTSLLHEEVTTTKLSTSQPRFSGPWSAMNMIL
jgi:hypothetical protein